MLLSLHEAIRPSWCGLRRLPDKSGRIHRETIYPVNGQYHLSLPGASNQNASPPSSFYHIGGRPYILIEAIQPTAQIWQIYIPLMQNQSQAGGSLWPPTPTPTPIASPTPEPKHDAA